MNDYYILALLIAASFTHLKAQYFSTCPYAAISEDLAPLFQEQQKPLASAASRSYASTVYPNSLKNYNTRNLKMPVSTWLQRFLMDEVNDMPQNESSLLSENTILKGLFDESKESTATCANPPENCANDTTHYYYRSIDGSCNNLQNPGYGMSRSRYGRLVQPKYSGSTGYAPTTSTNGEPLPNARLLSLSLYGEETFMDDRLTLAFMQFGQVVGHDISRQTTDLPGSTPDDCCTNAEHKMCYPVALHPNGPIKLGSEKSCLSFLRAISDVDRKCGHNPYYAEKISEVTSYFDLSYIYGNSEKENKKVRHSSGGLLKTSFVNNRQWLPVSMNVDGECNEDNFKCYSIPDPRNQLIPTIAIMQTILVREHNRLACALAHLNPQWSDEKVYQEARKINIAQYQKITYYDWLPHLIGPSFAYANRLIHLIQGGDYINDYDPLVNPVPYAESAAAALRYAHTQVPGFFSLVSPNRMYNQTMRLSDYFEKPANIDFLMYADNFDSTLRGMATQPQKRSDTNVDRELKHYLNRKITDEYGSDLKAFDIQRGRDFGLASYNDMRVYCGLPRAIFWSDLINEISVEKIEILQKLYKDPEDIDLAIGGSLEAHAPEAILGPTFRCIVGKQFLSLRIGDRFFYENENLFSGFSREQLAEIRKVSLSGLFCNNGDYLQFMQPNAFFIPKGINALQSCSAIPQLDLRKWKAVQQEAFH